MTTPTSGSMNFGFKIINNILMLPKFIKPGFKHVNLSNLQCYHFDTVILRAAIISNVQNVRLQRRDRPTDDASTRRWHGSQQANKDTFITSKNSNTFFK